MTRPAAQRPVMIGVTGTHSTGKSTFLTRLASILRHDHRTVASVASLGEQARRLGLPTLVDHTTTSTLWIITRGISEEVQAGLHADVVLVDRPVPDALAYYHAAHHFRGHRPSPADLRYLTDIVRGHSPRYDVLLRTTLDPTIPIGINKPRDTNAAFRELVDQHIGHVLAEFDLPHVLLPADGHDQALARVLDLVRTEEPANPPR